MLSDESIVSLFWERKEEAISETEKRYGGYLLRIAKNILQDPEDSREVVNDAYFKAWCTIPPQKPALLGAYLAKIARESAIDIFRARNRKKRVGSEYLLSLNELEECIPTAERVEEKIEAEDLIKSIEAYLRTLTKEKRVCFICRYFYQDSLKDIAGAQGMSLGALKTLLSRLRKGLKAYLEKEGYHL